MSEEFLHYITHPPIHISIFMEMSLMWSTDGFFFSKLKELLVAFDFEIQGCPTFYSLAEIV